MSDDKKTKAQGEPQKKSEPVTSEEVVKLKQLVAELEVKAADYENRWKRATADYQNLEKRTEERRGEIAQFALKSFMDKFLNVLDDLEMAHKHLKDKGLELAMKKMGQLLQENGLERIETVGKEYDVLSMEAINIVDGEKDNVVVLEHRPGYLWYGSVLRPAQVTVSKKSIK